MDATRGALEGSAGTRPAKSATESPTRLHAPLELRNFSAGYSASELPVVDASFVLERGSMTALVGPNGAGKSTMLKGILGLTPVHDPSAARFFGEPLERVRGKVAYLPQRSELDWSFPASALDIVAMGLYGRLGLFRRVGRAARAEAREALALVGLAHAQDKPIGELSGGQRQRVLVARALVQRAELVLLDEPFANVDEVTEQTIARVLQELRAQGTTILAVHHDLGTVRSIFADAILFNTRVLAHGPVRATLADASVARAYGLALNTAPDTAHDAERNS